MRRTSNGCSPRCSSATARRASLVTAEPHRLRPFAPVRRDPSGFAERSSAGGSAITASSWIFRARCPAGSARRSGTRRSARRCCGNEAPDAFDSWAVHAGGRSVLDSVEHGPRPPARSADGFARRARPLRQHVVLHPAVRAPAAARRPEAAGAGSRSLSVPAWRRRASTSSGRREVAGAAGPRRRADGRSVARPEGL